MSLNIEEFKNKLRVAPDDIIEKNIEISTKRLAVMELYPRFLDDLYEGYFLNVINIHNTTKNPREAIYKEGVRCGYSFISNFLSKDACLDQLKVLYEEKRRRDKMKSKKQEGKKKCK